MVEIAGAYFLTVQNKDGSYVWHQKQFFSFNEALAFAVREYLQAIWSDVPDAEELGLREPVFRNNAYASLELETGTIARIYISRSTYGVSGFKGNVQSITIESADALFGKAREALKDQPAH